MDERLAETAAEREVQGDGGQVDHDRAEQHDEVPLHADTPDQEPTQQRADAVAAIEDAGQNEAATTKPYPTSRGRIDGGATSQPWDAAAAHMSIGQVNANIVTNPANTGYRRAILIIALPLSRPTMQA